MTKSADIDDSKVPEHVDPEEGEPEPSPVSDPVLHTVKTDPGIPEHTEQETPESTPPTIPEITEPIIPEGAEPVTPENVKPEPAKKEDSVIPEEPLIPEEPQISEKADPLNPKVDEDPDKKPKPIPTVPEKYKAPDLSKIDFSEYTSLYPEYSLPPVGIRRSGLTCYLNAAIQLLFSSTDFVKLIADGNFDEKTQPISIIFQRLLKRYKDAKQGDIIDADELFKQIETTVTLSFHHDYSGLGDPDVVVEYALRHINDENKNKVLFKYNMKDSNICLNCGHEETVISSFNMFIWHVKYDGNIPEKGVILTGLPEVGLRLEPDISMLEGVYCDFCCGKHTNLSKTEPEEYADSIVVRINKHYFCYTDGVYKMVTNEVEIPPVIDVRGELYRFVSSCNISPVSGGGIGHYTAYLRRNDKFYFADDTSISQVEEFTNSSYVYMVLYEKMKKKTP